MGTEVKWPFEKRHHRLSLRDIPCGQGQGQGQVAGTLAKLMSEVKKAGACGYGIIAATSDPCPPKENTGEPRAQI